MYHLHWCVIMESPSLLAPCCYVSFSFHHCAHALFQDCRNYHPKLKQVHQVTHEVGNQPLLSEQLLVVPGKLEACLWYLLVCDDPEMSADMSSKQQGYYHSFSGITGMPNLMTRLQIGSLHYSDPNLVTCYIYLCKAYAAPITIYSNSMHSLVFHSKRIPHLHQLFLASIHICELIYHLPSQHK